MSNVAPGLLYTKDDEWLRLEGDEAVIGISDYAQDSLSDIVFLELPEVGDSFGQGDVFGVVESVKAAADLFTPIAGEITAVNAELVANPEQLNTTPYDGLAGADQDEHSCAGNGADGCRRLCGLP